jgi:predicted lipoprotein with Yx(FWY)xxD motif
MSKKVLALLAALAVSIPAFAAFAPLAGAHSTRASAASARPTITVQSTKFGKALFSHGRALYVFGPDRGSKSNCYGSCASAWPPFLASGNAKAGAGVRGSLIGTTRRKDGSSQVTYAGHPLYFYTGDVNSQPKCQGVNLNGGIWLIVSPSGKIIH